MILLVIWAQGMCVMSVKFWKYAEMSTRVESNISINLKC